MENQKDFRIRGNSEIVKKATKIATFRQCVFGYFWVHFEIFGSYSSLTLMSVFRVVSIKMFASAFIAKMAFEKVQFRPFCTMMNRLLAK